MKNKRGGGPKATPGGTKRGRTATLPTAKNKRNRGGVASRPRPADAPPRDRRPGAARIAGPTREQRHGPTGAPLPRPTRPKSASQAKARAKARKAKAPKVVRPPLRERLIARLAQIDLNPRALIARVPFVVLVIAALGVGLGVTLWLSTDAAERSYQLGHARKVNQTLQQQKESLERQVLEAQAAPALAEAARSLGMIPSRDTAHLVQDGAGNWLVVGTPKPAEGVSPPPLNVKLGVDRVPAAPPPPPAPPVPPPPPAPAPVPLDHAAAGSIVAPMGGPVTGPAPGPVQGPAPGPVQGPPPGPVPDATASAPAVPAPAPPAAPLAAQSAAPAPEVATAVAPEVATAVAPVQAPAPAPVPAAPAVAPVPAPAPGMPA